MFLPFDPLHRPSPHHHPFCVLPLSQEPQSRESEALPLAPPRKKSTATTIRTTARMSKTNINLNDVSHTHTFNMPIDRSLSRTHRPQFITYSLTQPPKKELYRCVGALFRAHSQTYANTNRCGANERQQQQRRSRIAQIREREIRIWCGRTTRDGG